MKIQLAADLLASTIEKPLARTFLAGAPFSFAIPAMPKSARREQIESMLQSEPDDRFLRYCLAVEMQAEGESQAALAKFEELCRENPPHVAAYFRRAQLLVELEQIEPARAVLREGIEIARGQHDLHAAGEMSELLADLGQWGE